MKLAVVSLIIFSFSYARAEGQDKSSIQKTFPVLLKSLNQKIVRKILPNL